LGVRYGAVQAVQDVSFTVAPGELIAVLGPNGAGKTSTLRAISGLVPHSGTITVDLEGGGGEDGADPGEGGVSHLPQGRGLFRRLTVEQNLSLAGYGRGRRAGRDAVEAAIARVPELAQFRGRRVGTLSGGEQALVAIGRLLAADPRYALLDEPTLGLAPAGVARLMDEVAALRAGGCGVVLVEQYAARALAIADRVLVLGRGRTAYIGDPAGVGDPEALVRSYLGAPA
jgi:branched-chain amino acid transport system ATP-binding protein